MSSSFRIKAIAAALATGVSVFASPGVGAVTVDLDYDLTSSALHTDYDSVNGLDWYTSLPMALGGTMLTPTDTTLVVNVTFRSASSLPQLLILDQMGLGGAQNAPATFGSPSFIGSGVDGGHGFGPSLTLVGGASLTSSNAVIVPTVHSGTLAAGFTGGVSGTCSGAGSATCDYGVLLPDLIDGATTMALSGFSVTFSFSSLAAPAAADFLTFNAIAPGITVAQVPEPHTVALMTLGLLGLGGLARHRQGPKGG